MGNSDMTSMSDAGGKLLDAVHQTYFQPLDEPLKKGARFLYSMLGSFSFFLATPLVLEARSGGIGDDSFESVILGHGDAFLTYCIFVAFLSCFYAWIISAAQTRHGPVRLYISGILLPVLLVSLARIAWSFG